MYTAIKYRLYPFPKQERILRNQLEELRLLWNYALEQRQDAWKLGKRISYIEQAQLLPHWKSSNRNRLRRIYSTVLQDCLARLDDAFQDFFRRCNERKAGKKIKRLGYPQYKREAISLTYPSVSQASISIIPGRNGTLRLHLPKNLGDIPIKVSRKAPAGDMKTCTIKREGDRWYAIIVYDIPDAAPPSVASPTNPVGIDLGLTNLAVLSTGETVEPPKFLEKSIKRLKRLDREVSRKKKGSHNREKARVRRSRYYTKIRDKRIDFAHKLTTGWVKKYDLISFEDMNIAEFIQNNRHAKSMADASWGILRQMCEYKEQMRSGRYVEVPTKNTTQTCSTCGELAEPRLELKDRMFRSDACPHTEDRDLNAAKNVVARALAIVGTGSPEVTPAETRPPPHRKTRRVWSMKQEPPHAIHITGISVKATLDFKES